MSVTLSVKSQDSSGITYADPAKPDCTVRFRFSNTNKVLNGVTVANYATEIIVNDNNDVTVGGVSAKDAISIRIRTSAALESAARLRDLLTSIAVQLDDWDTEHVCQGFRPTTAPVIQDAL